MADDIITRLHPKDCTKAEIFVGGSLVATIPMYQIELLVKEMKEIQSRPIPPDAVILAPPR